MKVQRVELEPLVLEGKNFNQAVKAFLDAIWLSRPNIIHALRRHQKSQPFNHIDQLQDEIDNLQRELKSYKGFTVKTARAFGAAPQDKLAKEPPSVEWICQEPAPPISCPHSALTRIRLEWNPQKNCWQIRISARDEKTAKQRLTAAMGQKAARPARRIVDAQNGLDGPAEKA